MRKYYRRSFLPRWVLFCATLAFCSEIAKAQEMTGVEEKDLPTIMKNMISLNKDAQAEWDKLTSANEGSPTKQRKTKVCSSGETGDRKGYEAEMHYNTESMRGGATATYNKSCQVIAGHAWKQELRGGQWVNVPPEKDKILIPGLWEFLKASKKAALLRRGLETQRSRKTISEEEYKKRDDLISRYENVVVKAYLVNQNLVIRSFGQNFSPSTERQDRNSTKDYPLSTVFGMFGFWNASDGPSNASAKEIDIVLNDESAQKRNFTIAYAKLLYEHKALGEDLIRKVINRAEYEEKLKDLLAKRRAWAKAYPVSEEEEDEYNVLIDRLPGDLVELEKFYAANRPLSEKLVPWATPFATVLGIVLTYQLSRRKDKREKRELEMKESKLNDELKELRQKNEKLQLEVAEAHKKAEERPNLIVLASEIKREPNDRTERNGRTPKDVSR